jgi:legumain
MFKLKFAVAALLGLVSVTAVPSDHWAVIVVGSNGYYNYRHQADGCHAYQVLKKSGIPTEQIIMLSYNDVASDSENPFPGQLFNKPDGPDVNLGCHIDYNGTDVTPENFLSVLKGDSAAMAGKGNGKVLKSNENSKVFVNFVDHGAPGLIAFPNKYLYANDLNTTITYMHENKMYDQLVLYIEACESGSMFDGILSDKINAYAVTAANPTESSFGTYCYPDEVVNGTHLNTCLGDLFSVKWLENVESSDLTKETLETQFSKV